MPDDLKDPIAEMSERERVVSILKGLKLPRGQYYVSGSGAMILHNIQRTRKMGDLDLFVSTALWFQIYESTQLVWGLWLPDSRDTLRKCDPPYLYVDILGLPVHVFFDWRKRDYGGNINVAETMEKAVRTEDHWPTLPLDELLRVKREMHRDKDIDDIAILEEVLG